MVLAFLGWPRSPGVSIPSGFDPADPNWIARGGYVARAGGCLGCHWDRSRGRAPYAGGRAMETPFGILYSANLTPDPETGIGGWSAEEFVRAVQHGLNQDGQSYYPAFPFTSYRRMTDQDAAALYAYFQSLDPVVNKVADHELPFPLSWRGMMTGWRLLFWHGQDAAPKDRGQYLVEVLGHCGECHSPRNIFGAVDEKAGLVGNPNGPEGEKVPAINPSAPNMQNWTAEEIAEMLKTGFTPEFDNLQGSMLEVIEEGLSHLSDDDLLAIATFLKEGRNAQ